MNNKKGAKKVAGTAAVASDGAGPSRSSDVVLQMGATRTPRQEPPENVRNVAEFWRHTIDVFALTDRENFASPMTSTAGTVANERHDRTPAMYPSLLVRAESAIDTCFGTRIPPPRSYEHASRSFMDELEEADRHFDMLYGPAGPPPPYSGVSREQITAIEATSLPHSKTGQPMKCRMCSKLLGYMESRVVMTWCNQFFCWRCIMDAMKAQNPCPECKQVHNGVPVDMRTLY